MANSDAEMKSEIREFTRYQSTAILSTGEMKTVLKRAKRHIRTTKGIESDTFDWYKTYPREDALFWTGCLFAKVAVGELDSEDIQVGAIDLGGLMAVENDEVTMWAKNVSRSLNALDSGGPAAYGHGITSVSREGRVYEDDSTDSTSL